jgi:hypothetical protein
MKITNYIIALTIGIAGLTACDYLDKMPDDQLTIDMIFADKVRTEDWLASVYSSVPNPCWNYFKDHGYNIMADDMTIPVEWRPFGWANVYAFTVGDWNPNSAWNPYFWVELPKRIRTGLIFIERAKPNEEQGATVENIERMKNECRFLIAYYYSLMLELYGPIPFKPGVIEPVGAAASELMISQSPYDEVVDWVDAELKEVSNNLPAVYSDNNDWGRATKIMCLAIRARMLLTAASPLFNGNSDYRDWKNSDGVNLLKSDYDPQKWARAAQAHKELIDAAEAAGHRLYYEYNDDGSIDPFMSCYNLSLKKYSEGNREILFGRADPGGLNDWQAHHLPKGIGGNAGMGVTQELVDAFYTKNGLPITDPNSGYVEKGFSTENEIRNTRWPGAWGPDRIDGCVTLANTYNMYCNREPRFYVSVIYNGAWLEVDRRRTEFCQGGRDTGLTFDAPQNGYNARKRISLEVFPREGRYNYQPGILYRLAEAYLGYAEALNESSPDHSDVLRYLNLVRERAGIPPVPSGTSQGEIREIIRRERRVEFNCEGIRLHDLRRWKLAEEELNKSLSGMNFLGTDYNDDETNPNAFFKRSFYKNRIFTKKMYLWPVPQAQMDINPNLVQAPGY